MTDRNAAAMGKSVKEDPAKGDDGKAKNRDKSSNSAATGNHKTPTKKRRKVNHACVYCRRSERPCTRCIKRNIGHLCHDEPRDADSKKAKSVQSIQSTSVVDESDAQSDMARSSISSTMGPPPNFDATRQRGAKGFGGVLGQGSPLSIVQPGHVSGLQGNTLNNGNSNANQFAGFQDAWMTAQNHFHDMHSFHPNYMIAPEVTHEFNLLNDFLHTSLLDDGGVPSEDSQQSPAAFRRSSQSEMLPGFGNSSNSLAAGGSNPMSNNMSGGSMLPPPTNNLEGKAIPRPGSVVPADKAREYYLQAADPSGNDTPEERMARVLKAKYDAGLLKPFNYIKGYARLGTYLDSHIAPSSKQKILRTINQFRPKFREKAQALTDMELVYVEMWFEKQLMDYDRVFASMAVPACCWRRTGEIFRGNKEMAELIGVSVAQLRDGKIALHEILTEESMVRYWEEFGTIAFDPAHETLLTACSLKNPTPGSNHPIVKCCFSFMIRRDDHKFMASVDPLSIGRDRKIRGLIEFSADLLPKLPTSHDSSSTDTLLADLSHHITTVNAISQKPGTVSPETAEDLKEAGRSLWNECVREKRKRNDVLASPSRSKLLVRTRLFSFLINVFARESLRGRKGNVEDDAVAIINQGLMLAKICINEPDLDAARLGLGKVTKYIDKLRQLDAENHIGPGHRLNIEAEYLTMRCALSSKEDRLDVAEHMYTKADDLLRYLDPFSAEQLADTLQDIGTNLSGKGDHEMALKWLRRAHALINGQELERLSTEGLEIRMSIHHDLIQTLLATRSPERVQEADDLVSYVESEIGDKPVVLHWKLEILQRSPGEIFDVDACASILRRMVRSLDLSDVALGFLLHNIKELRDRGSRLAIGLLDELLLTRLLPCGNMDWIGKTLVRRIWMGTMETEASDAATRLLQLLEQLAEDSRPCNVDVAAAAQSREYNVAELWCRVALHPIFSSTGEVSQGKFGRRLILCAIARSDADAAKSTFDTLPTAVQNDQLTRYLMFKVSLISWDHDLGRQCVEFLSKSSEKAKSRDILYACVREAQQLGDRLCTLEALKAVTETFTADSSTAAAANLPSVLRCAIRLVHIIETQDNQGADQASVLIQDTCDVFEKAAEHAKSDPRGENGNKVFTVPELEWFRKNAYNVGVTNACLAFIECYPQDISSENSADLQLMAMRCHFVMAAAIVSKARTEDKADEALQRYLEVRQHVAVFDGLFEKHFQNTLAARSARVYTDLTAKMSTLFVFDFEGAICLKDWDDLGQIIRKARVCKDEKMYKAMGDCLLRSNASGNVVYTNLRLIINEIFALEQFDNQRLAKYLRCMFQAVLPLDDSLALQVVEQALEIARECNQMQKPFPTDELDWIVVTTFNHALDIHSRGDGEMCQQWAHKALALAEYMSDRGDLKDILRERVAKLCLGKGTSTSTSS
ncbi:meiosis protein SPO22/ZIP4 like-domain-containing protein [Fusarium solani]|uniref:Meiosis protein SPO22/ZIP4 like-domain-containing protein n=1 Tax=Fusarium solani TaxID=169388 RepID=A0A9P9H3Z6_FUSSL|nr:meiosis protein SPO22/ZIP4 like-domain-containing protein [Fusarium solani]KAH7250591.1 meiosis protein SPO22/ZIP4 like-domain-containing protein [Fusarium solani]